MKNCDLFDKCHDKPYMSGFKDKLPGYTNKASKNANNIKEKEKTNSRTSFVQCRYIVTLVGFFVYFQVDCYRIATSMSLVKMVNSTAVTLRKNAKFEVDSCPVNNSIPGTLPNIEEEGEFNWDPEIQSYITSAGFLGYIICQIPGGMLAATYGAKNVLFCGLVVSSLAHMMCPLAAWTSSYCFLAMQFIRGVGQGFLPPAVAIMAAKWFPRPERGFLNSVIFEGYVIGSLLTYLVSGALCSLPFFGGWPLVYFVYGALGLAFSCWVYVFLYESPKDHPGIEKAELIYIVENQESDLSDKPPPTPWRKLLTSVPVWAVTYSVFSEFWAMTQQLSVHPLFLANILHFRIEANGMLNSIPYVFQIPMILLGGWISKWLNTRGYVSVDKVRKGCTMLYSLGYSMGLLGTYFSGCNRLWSNLFSTIAFSFVGLATPGCLIVPADMSPTYAGSLSSFSNTVASSATFAFPLIVGAMIDKKETLEQWKQIFLICIAINLSSGILFCIFGSAEIQSWNFQPTEDKKKSLPKNEKEVAKRETKSRTVEISSHL